MLWFKPVAINSSEWAPQGPVNVLSYHNIHAITIPIHNNDTFESCCYRVMLRIPLMYYLVNNHVFSGVRKLNLTKKRDVVG